MSRVRTILLSAGLTALACVASAADTSATALLPADFVSAFKLSANAGDYAKMATATVTGQPFKSALRIEVTKKPQRPGDVMISAPLDATLASGDVLMVSFWMRSGIAGDATLDAGFRSVPGTAPASGAPGARGGAGAAAGAPGAPPVAAGAPGARGGAGAGGGAAGRGRGGFGGQPALNAPAMAGTAWKKVQFPFALTRAYNKGAATCGSGSR
jgi:hypothetical protein